MLLPVRAVALTSADLLIQLEKYFALAANTIYNGRCMKLGKPCSTCTVRVRKVLDSQVCPRGAYEMVIFSSVAGFWA